MYHQIDLDVCLYVGYCRNYPHHISRLDKILLPDYVEDELLKRTYRLYFCPKDFAPPVNLIEGGKSVEFLKLKYHIIKCSCVFCNGGKDEGIFTCKSNY